MDRQAALKAPPKVVDALFSWAREEIAAKVLEIATARHASNLAASKDKTLSKHFRAQFTENVEYDVKLIAEAKRFATRPGNPMPMAFLPLDLTGWPYKLPKSVPTEIAVMVMFKTTAPLGAAQFLEGEEGRPGIGVITFHAPEHKLRDLRLPAELTRLWARIETAIEHESQHLSQALLRRATGNESAGHPTARPHKHEEYDPFKEPAKHHTNPQEFWPLLDSVAREIHLKLKDVPEAARAAEMRRLIENEPMLKSLAAKSRSLWTKAVRELAKKLGPDGLTLRVAARFASR